MAQSTTSFKILGMDCAEEVSTLKRELGAIVGGEENLSFDLLSSRMNVAARLDSGAQAELIRAVKATGMEAIPWRGSTDQESAGEQDSFWRRKGRGILCWVSGACLGGGLLWHTLRHGSLADALTGGGGAADHVYPSLSLALYVGAVIVGGWPIAPKAWHAARRLRPDMNLLMFVAVMGAMGIGEWLEAAVVTFLFAVALLLESWSMGRARRAIKALVELSPDTARVVSPKDGSIEERNVKDVPVGTVLSVRPGEKIPLDGVVAKNEPSVDQASITGESLPVMKMVGDDVFAGTINGDIAFELRTTKPSADTTLARIIRLVEESQSRRAPSELWVDRFARVYTPVMMALALMIAVLPPLLAGGSWGAWFYQGLVILVIACPCALVISTPVSIVAGLTSAARAGVLIKGGAYLEAPARLQAIAMDKTGTLTHGRPEVMRIIPMNGHTRGELLSRAAALEVHSPHPLARAILSRSRAEDVSIIPAENYQVIQGKGAEGTIQGREFWVGSHRFVEDIGAEDQDFHKMAVKMEDAGHSLVIVGNPRHICGVFCVADAVRDQAPKAVAQLKRLGISEIVMLTGDNERVAEAVASVTGVDRYEAELLPEDKVKAIEKLREKWDCVAMVGDGVNDAPAMAAADVGIAMGAIGADAAIECADIALMSDELDRLPWLIRHSRRTLGVIKQNIVFALGIKLAFIILAVAGLAQLWMAIAADMGASLLVIFNGLRLLRPGPYS